MASGRRRHRVEHDPPPETVDPAGVPRHGAGADGFVLLLAACVAIAALVVTLGWVVIAKLGA